MMVVIFKQIYSVFFKINDYVYICEIFLNDLIFLNEYLREDGQ